MASNGQGPGNEQKAARRAAGNETDASLASVEQTCAAVEHALGKSPAFKTIEPRLYVVKQGSSYVMITVLASGPNQNRALVRVTAQVVAGVRPEPSLFRQLLILNGTLRFGAFAYVPEGDLVLFTHSLLGGSTLDANEVVATVHDVALVADAYDDRIVARYGGRRMQDVIEESALNHLLNPDEEELLPEEPVASQGKPSRRAPTKKAAAKGPTKATAKGPAKATTRKAAAKATTKGPAARPAAKKAPVKKPAAKAPSKPAAKAQAKKPAAKGRATKAPAAKSTRTKKEKA